jgi:hypothetical protein
MASHSRGTLYSPRNQMHQVFVSLMQTQRTRVRTIFELYPLESERIGPFRLSHSLVYKLDREEIANALAYTSHCVVLISHYLFIPLRYPIRLRSSRSTISDHISRSFEGPKEYCAFIRFPLYLRGSDRLRFEYAVFLLNKNVEQIMNAVGLPIRNLRATLENIQAIALRIEKSQSKYQSLTRQEPTGSIDWNYVRTLPDKKPSSISSSQAL